MTHKPLPILSDMPWHVKQKIVGFTDPYTQMNLQLCSKELQKVVEKAPCVYKWLEITLSANEIVIYLFSGAARKNFTIRFEQRGQQVVIQKFIVLTSFEVEGDFLEEAVKYLEKKIFYKTPRNLVSVQELRLHLDRGYKNYEGYEDKVLAFLEMLKTTFGFLCARKIHLDIEFNEQRIASVFRCFQPRTLRDISLYCIVWGDSQEVVMTEVAGLEQWKQARELRTFGFTVTEPYESWKHLEVEFMTVVTLSLDALKDIIQRLAQSPTWSKTRLTIERIPQDVQDYFDRLPVFDEITDTRKIDIQHCDSLFVTSSFFGKVMTLKKVISEKSK